MAVIMVTKTEQMMVLLTGELLFLTILQTKVVQQVMVLQQHEVHHLFLEIQ